MASTEFMESEYPLLLDRRGVLRLTETASTGRARTYARVQDPRRGWSVSGTSKWKSRQVRGFMTERYADATTDAARIANY
jgi:hypothetical protein